MNYLIIGNSTAAIACIEAIRKSDKTGSLTVLSKEKQFCYGRPTISYYLAGVTTKEHMKYRPDDFYEKHGVTLHAGVTAERIDAAKKQVYASDKRTYAYDKLLVATGSVPLIPQAEGLEKTHYHTFLSYGDMENLESLLTKDKTVVIIGAGLIGLKCAEGILHRVKSLTVIDLANRILPSVTDMDSANFVKSHLEEQGMHFILGDCAVRYTQNSVLLKSGKEVYFDVLIMAAGVRPNVVLLEEAGAEINRGAVVDKHMQTTLRDVYAAGDCTEGYDSSTGKNRVLALLPNAYMQGKTAGVNMAGGSAEYHDAIPLNAVGFFGIHMLSAGVYEGECFTEKSENAMKKLFVKDGILVGFILINDVARAGIYTALVREKTPLESVDFALLKDAPQLLAFSTERRRNKLARKV